MADEDAAQPTPVANEPAQPVSEAASEPSGPAALQQSPEAQTAQIPVNEPFDSAHDKPLPSELEPSAPAQSAATPQTVPPPTNFARNLLTKARAAIQSRKQKKLAKILELLDAKRKITNDEVEKLLHVSDATATRYLSELEKQGKIKQVGKTGKAVEYTRI
jgi:ribosomal protein S25